LNFKHFVDLRYAKMNPYFLKICYYCICASAMMLLPVVGSKKV